MMLCVATASCALVRYRSVEHATPFGTVRVPSSRCAETQQIGKATFDYAQDIFNLLPNLKVEELVKSFAIKTNDMLVEWPPLTDPPASSVRVPRVVISTVYGVP